MEDPAGRSIAIAIVASKHAGRFIIESAAVANACNWQARRILRQDEQTFTFQSIGWVHVEEAFYVVGPWHHHHMKEGMVWSHWVQVCGHWQSLKPWLLLVCLQYHCPYLSWLVLTSSFRRLYGIIVIFIFNRLLYDMMSFWGNPLCQCLVICQVVKI